ncbi:D-isomer specific 2-hydroxyacid dehydrogenase NAD-binding protein [Companilactobacillus tucceti DSM 20183]|uniref:D-isomer specific 2-hydroxyacid dehydrogenase NAD-binding protein n=1 Tax=Companilactobacillus tucceti DSM 20183 TaxID=1423811 RepID=A0A0R1J7Q2_9LACO|nr:D-2-hydroxyacid dehydrogenase [Companilactobacillus tucceti]KRK64857.1 D-isomer specific 2-hydroxyacid dehydrogenase NAD-binding protein [Companilactobacillus tucceti DSM 20183]
MKVLSLVDLTDKQKQELEEIKGVDLNVVSAKSVTAEDLKGVEVLFDWSKKLQDDIVKSDTLNWIQTIRAGVDALPLRALDEKGILLSTGSGANSINIAEQALAYMLMFERSMNLSTWDQTKKVWHREKKYDEVYNKTVMLVGVGHIGSQLAQYAKALGMHTIGVRHSDKSLPNIDKMVAMKDIDKHLKEADFVVNSLPDTSDTEKMFNKEFFQKMAKTAYFISIGRGKSTDTNDLVEALQTKEIAGAGLDVVDPEPLNEDSPLWDMKNVILTPHNAGRSVHYEERAFKIFKKNLKSYIENGEVVENLVNYSKGY